MSNCPFSFSFSNLEDNNGGGTSSKGIIIMIWLSSNFYTLPYYFLSSLSFLTSFILLSLSSKCWQIFWYTRISSPTLNGWLTSTFSLFLVMQTVTCLTKLHITTMLPCVHLYFMMLPCLIIYAFDSQWEFIYWYFWVIKSHLSYVETHLMQDPCD